MVDYTPPLHYAFPAAYIQKYEKQLRYEYDYHSVHCAGHFPVKMKGGGLGYKFITCWAELENPAIVWQFTINQRTGRITRHTIV